MNTSPSMSQKGFCETVPEVIDAEADVKTTPQKTRFRDEKYARIRDTD